MSQLLTFYIQIEMVRSAPADGVGSLTCVVTSVVCGEALQHEASVAHDDSLSDILPQLFSLNNVECWEEF